MQKFKQIDSMLNLCTRINLVTSMSSQIDIILRIKLMTAMHSTLYSYFCVPGLDHMKRRKVGGRAKV